MNKLFCLLSLLTVCPVWPFLPSPSPPASHRFIARSRGGTPLFAASRRRDNQSRLPPRRRHNQSKRYRKEYLEAPTVALIESAPGTLKTSQLLELSSLMTAWSDLAGRNREAPLILESLLKRLLDEREAGNGAALVTTNHYNCVIDGWAAQTKGKGKFATDAAKRARAILLLMQRNYERYGHLCKPNAQAFDTVLRALAKAGDHRRCEYTLRWMDVLHEIGKNPSAKPTIHSYISLMDAIANSGQPDAGEQVEALIKIVRKKGLMAGTLCYTIAIKAWNRAKRGREGAEAAQRILDEMPPQPSIYTYSGVINAWAKSGLHSLGALRAEAILRRIKSDSRVQLNQVVYNGCMDAWRRSGNVAAVRRSETLLAEMTELGVEIDLVTYNTYIHVLATHGGVSGMADKANDVLCMLEEKALRRPKLAPNIFSYNKVGEAWAKSNDENAPAQAFEVLKRVLNNPAVQPNTFTLNQVLLAFSNSNTPRVAEKVEKLLVELRESYAAGLIPVEPDVGGYSVAINAWARSGSRDAVDHSTRLLYYLEERAANGEKQFMPTIVTYNAVIDAWARSGQGVHGARKAEEVLRRMQARYEAGNSSVQPNRATYNSLLNAWELCGSRCCAHKAQQYLNEMWKLHQSGNKKVRPDGRSYNTLISAISKSPNSGKAQKALRVLRQMDKLYQSGYEELKPDEFTYTLCLNSCAVSNDFDERSRMRAMDTALFVWEEFKETQYGKPTDVAYVTFLRACANLIPQDDGRRMEIVKPVFAECCGDGLVSSMVLKQLKVAAPDTLFAELLGEVVTDSNVEISKDDLPADWTCNLRKPLRARVQP